MGVEDGLCVLFGPELTNYSAQIFASTAQLNSSQMMSARTLRVSVASLSKMSTPTPRHLARLRHRARLLHLEALVLRVL